MSKITFVLSASSFRCLTSTIAIRYAFSASIVCNTRHHNVLHHYILRNSVKPITLLHHEHIVPQQCLFDTTQVKHSFQKKHVTNFKASIIFQLFLFVSFGARHRLLTAACLRVHPLVALLHLFILCLPLDEQCLRLFQVQHRIFLLAHTRTHTRARTFALCDDIPYLELSCKVKYNHEQECATFFYTIQIQNIYKCTM